MRRVIKQQKGWYLSYRRALNFHPTNNSISNHTNNSQQYKILERHKSSRLERYKISMLRFPFLLAVSPPKQKPHQA